MADTEQVKEAAEAYIYGYPLVYDLQEVGDFVEGGGSLPIQAPYNTFGYARRLLGPETKFVSYDVPDFYLVANPIDRYSIGDRTPGLTPLTTAR